jgi:hypothetical protein
MPLHTERFRRPLVAAGATLFIGGGVLVTAGPALAASPSVSPHAACSVAGRGEIQCMWAGSTSGWERGNIKITISAKFNGNEIQSPTSKTCIGETSCATQVFQETFSGFSGSLEVTVTASGPGHTPITKSATGSA